MRLLTAVAVLAAVSGACTSPVTPAQTQVSAPNSSYNSAWWQTLSADARDGFVSGYLDCYIWAVPAATYPDNPVAVIVKRLSHFYAANKGSEAESVPDVLRGLGTRHEGRPAGEAHGVYDGDFWRQCLGRVAFIEGYLECERLHSPNRFSKKPGEYASRISQWYGVSDTDESALDDYTANDKIGEVLFRLRDGAPPLSR